MRLSDETEEVAGFYARMIEHEYTTKDIFNKNFMEDWRKVMTDEERKVIKDLQKCNFREIFHFYEKVLVSVILMFINYCCALFQAFVLLFHARNEAVFFIFVSRKQVRFDYNLNLNAGCVELK